MIPLSTIDAVPFLRALSPAAKADLASRAVVRSYRPRQRLWTAGEGSKGLFVVLSGQVRVVRTTPRRVKVVHVEGPGATLGEVPLFAGGAYPATALAHGATSCLIVDRQSLINTIRNHPELALVLLERLAARLRRVLGRMDEQGGMPVMTRLARFLLSRPLTPAGAFTLGGTQQAIAEELGTVREVVVRLIAELVRDGIIARRARAQYVTTDPARLRALAADHVLADSRSPITLAAEQRVRPAHRAAPTRS